MQKSGSPGDHDLQPIFLPLGLAVVGLSHPDSTFSRGWCALVVEAPVQAHLTQLSDRGGVGGGGTSCVWQQLFFSGFLMSKNVHMRPPQGRVFVSPVRGPVSYQHSMSHTYCVGHPIVYVQLPQGTVSLLLLVWLSTQRNGWGGQHPFSVPLLYLLWWRY